MVLVQERRTSCALAMELRLSFLHQPIDIYIHMLSSLSLNEWTLWTLRNVAVIKNVIL